MFRKALLSALCSFGLVVSVGVSIAAELRPLTSGNWTGGVYSDDQTKRFSHCAAGVPYVSGIFMIVFVDRNFAWQLRFIDPAWNMAPNQQIPIAVRFDGGAPLTGTAFAQSSNAAAIPMAPTASLIHAFRASSVMAVDAAGQHFVFNLAGTSRLLVDLVRCVRSELAAEEGGATPQLSKVVSGATQGTIPSPIPSQEARSELQLAATRIATNLLLQAKFPNAQLLAPEETPEVVRNLGVAWRSDIGLGAVELLAPTAAQNAQQVASKLIDSDAATCKGDFDSGRSSELVDNSIVTRAFTGCKDSGGTKAFRYFVLHNEGGPFIVYALAGSSDAQPASTHRINDADFQAAAVKAAFHP